jgi:hypothetical protein
MVHDLVDDEVGAARGGGQEDGQGEHCGEFGEVQLQVYNGC